MLMMNRPMIAGFALNGFDGLLDEIFNASPFQNAREAGVYPPVNVREDENAYTVEAELPGFKMEDVAITLTGNELTVSGSRQCDGEAEGSTWRRRERISGQFSRTLVLSDGVSADKVDASLLNGVLTITLPKAESAKTRKITVRQA
ncbi:MAG TPA: Hsp20/alpha crystallin family protein [Phycisphaerales bacterium]|nr:Hsp20/alpha crystallin family protein [Phycisphaerales bacterium]